MSYGKDDIVAGFNGSEGVNHFLILSKAVQKGHISRKSSGVEAWVVFGSQRRSVQ